MAEVNVTTSVDEASNAATQTTLIRAILQDARTTGDTVYFPARLYKIDDWIFDSSDGFAANDFKGVLIRGDGPGKTVIRLEANVSQPVFRIAGDLVESNPRMADHYAWFTLRDMTLDGNSKTATWLKFHRSNSHRIDNVEFKNTVGRAIHGVNFWDSLIYNCTFDNCYETNLAAVHLQSEFYQPPQGDDVIVTTNQ